MKKILNDLINAQRQEDEKIRLEMVGPDVEEEEEEEQYDCQHVAPGRRSLPRSVLVEKAARVAGLDISRPEVASLVASTADIVNAMLESREVRSKCDRAHAPVCLVVMRILAELRESPADVLDILVRLTETKSLRKRVTRSRKTITTMWNAATEMQTQPTPPQGHCPQDEGPA